MKTIAFIDNFINDPINHGINEIILRHRLPGTFHQPARYGFKSLEDLGTPDGAIVFGSASHVTENEEWHQRLLDITKDWMEKEIPILGICFGHQLYAFHEGAKVDYIQEDQFYFQILREVEFQRDLWGIKQGEKLHLPYSHKQAVLTPPDNFEVIATAQGLPFEILKHEKAPLWTMQCHPESSEKFITETIKADTNTCEQVRLNGKRILDGFIEEVLST
jgi:GMP synthase (glutamine-hydrolysing)